MGRDQYACEEDTGRFDKNLNSLVPLIDQLSNNVQRLNGEFEQFKTDLENLTRKTEKQRQRQKQMSVTLVKLDTDVDEQMKVLPDCLKGMAMELESLKQTQSLFSHVGNVESTKLHAGPELRAGTDLDTTNPNGMHGASISVCLEKLAELGDRVDKEASQRAAQVVAVNKRISRELGALKKMVEGLAVDLHGNEVIGQEAFGVHEGRTPGVCEGHDP